MHSTFALAALAAVAYARPQGITQNIAPQAPAPQGCSPSYSGSFQIQAINVTSSSSKVKRQACGSEGTLTVKLADGVLLDGQGRTGYIAANYQFQFDKPAQTGSIYTAGFSSCGNGSLALGGSAIFYQCYSGGFYNLYDRHWAEQCNAIYLDILPCGGASSGGPAASQLGDGQPQVTSAAAAPVSQIGDGQIQATSAVPLPSPISQIGDGQIQVPTNIPTPISQIGDGQIQVPTAAPTPISQIGDGQIQVPTAAPTPISQIPDGQIQVPTTVAPKPTGAIVSQIPDGQIQSNGTTPVPFTGGASSTSSKASALLIAIAFIAIL